ncbi:MAG: gliding motility-associated C-terminal domain-containing protein [Bacteroidales bacterium]|nr:gliding motility-associated C-terminal domain-containing protein [Bacteroidales bacterium]
MACLLLLLATTGIVHAQELINHDTLFVCSQYGHSPYYTMPNQFQHEYTLNSEFEAWLVIDAGEAPVSFTFSSSTQLGGTSIDLPGYITVWDDDSATGNTLVNHFSGSDTVQTLVSSTGRLVVYIHYNACSDIDFRTVRTLSIQWVCSVDNPNPCAMQNAPFLSKIETTRSSILLKWISTSDSNIVRIDGRTFLVIGDSLNVTGLVPNTKYIVSVVPAARQDYPCCARRAVVYTDPIPYTGCPDVLDLTSNYARCTYGTTANPHQFAGIVNEGPGMTYSRHTVNRDTTQTDPITNDMLRLVGPGLPGSVRLGNWISGAQAESVTYYLHIDTTFYSIILLHYAAVLQDPDHTSNAQPRFVMQVLNEQNEVIDAECGAANFTANEGNGWNMNGVPWRDWTTVGINLAPYHGQDVKLRFTTYDCTLGGHYGYAYFYAECQQPFASASQCGDIDTVTLTAPEGFRYLWYTNSVANPFDTLRTVTANTSMGDIHCRLTFIENPECYITMNTHIDNYWPLAQIDTLFTVDKGCDGYEVHFRNRSTIVDDAGTPYPGNPTCDGAQWNFGNGHFSLQQNPVHAYSRPGTYTVTLIASLNGGLCRDTATFTITAPDAWAPKDQYLTCCDSILWIDSLWYSRDTVGPTCRLPFPATCDTIYTLHLTTLPSPHFTYPADTICYNTNHFWRNQMIPSDHTLDDTAYRTLTDTLLAANGCDSLVHQPFVQMPPDRLAIIVQPDCINGTYILSADTDKPLWHWSSSPHDSLMDGHDSDSSLMVAPADAIAYTLTSYYNDTLFCPTSVTKTLSHPEPHFVDFEVNPDVLTFEHHTLNAYDKSDDLNHRQWFIVNHGTVDDTVLLPGTRRRIDYPVDIEHNDSVTVILAIGDGYCSDSLSRTIPITRTNIFTPNVFTPDADVNNRFSAFCAGLLEGELSVYNRQGLLVFTTTDLATGWDGTHNGTPCPQGAYVWHLRARTADRPDDWHTLVGTVTLLR